MAWITLATEPGAKARLEHRRPELDMYEERHDADSASLTVVGKHSHVVIFLATEVAPDDDMNLAWLVSEIQLADETMDEHNAAASAVGL